MASKRREPSFSSDPETEREEGLRVSPEDRVGGGKKAASRRMAYADEEDEPVRPKKGGKRKKRRSFFGFLFYWTSVAAVWGFILVAGVVAWQATLLPPIDKLAVPKRPPNIAILSEDGRLIANRGDTGGAEVRLADLPPYLPKAFIAIEDRRFYSHWGIDPIGIARAVFRNASGRGNM